MRNALPHFRRYIRSAVYNSVHCSTRYAALLCDPLCSYLHKIFSFSGIHVSSFIPKRHIFATIRSYFIIVQ